MIKIKKELMKRIIVITMAISSICLFSCARFSLDVKVKGLFNVSTESNAYNNDTDESSKKIEIGPNLKELEGDVFTLSHFKLPKVGESLYGFKVEAIYDYEARNAKLVVFEYEKTGTKLVLISNDDEDKSAAFGFNTLTYDNKGIPHVFEHACLGGSYKYPNANLFMEATSKTYNTFMNALTMQNATVYPFSSLSDPQLFELYKFYFDGVMNPNVLRDKKNLEREAYRYILDDKNTDISLSGVVYSEMSGVEGNIYSVSYRNSLKTMFDGSFMGVNTGGVTTEIPKITFEELTEFHDKYYHPSNMIIALYGDIDYEKYLKYADEEYLSKYGKKEIDKNDSNYSKQDSFNIKRYDFPVSIDEDIEGKTIIDYNVICEGMSEYETGTFELVLSALMNSDGPINKRLKERYPKVDFEIQNGLCYPKPFFTIRFINADESLANDLKEIVEESFAEIVKDGINEEILESLLNAILYKREVSKDSHGFAGGCEYEFLMMFAKNESNPTGMLLHDKAINEIEELYKNGSVKSLAEKYLSNNENSSISITVPKLGLLEEKSNKLKQELIDMKKKLSDEEITDLINETKEYNAWVEEQTNNSLIEMLRKATLSELDEYRAKCYAYEENVEGINFIRSDIDDLKYNSFGLYFDISNFTIEDAMKLKLLSSLLMELPTNNYPGQKLKSAFERYLISFSEGISVNRYYDGGYKPYYNIYVKTLDQNIDKSFELLKEHMDETIFEDTDILKSVVSLNLNNYKNVANSNPTAIAKELIDAKTDDNAIYEYSISGINYINFLKNISEMSDSDLKNLLDEMKEIYNEVKNRNGLVCQIIGNFNTIKNIKSKVIDMSYAFNNKKIVNNIDIATISDIKDKTAVIVNGTVQYNYIATPLLKDDIKYTSKYAVLSSIIDSMVLYPEFRVKRSAYGSYSACSRLNSYIYTYRDPNLNETYKVFNEIPNIMSKIKLSDSELEDYKLNAYSSFSYPLSKYGAAEVAVSETFSKVSEKRPDRYIRYMKEIKEMTKEELPELNKLFEKMVNDGIYVTVGGKEQIEKNADIFDDIKYDYVK